MNGTQISTPHWIKTDEQKKKTHGYPWSIVFSALIKIRPPGIDMSREKQPEALWLEFSQQLHILQNNKKLCNN